MSMAWARLYAKLRRDKEGNYVFDAFELNQFVKLVSEATAKEINGMIEQSGSTLGIMPEEDGPR